MEKAVLERDAKNAHYKLNEAQLRLDEASRNLSDLESLRNKLVGENGELERKMDEAYSQVSQLNKIKVFTLIILGVWYVNETLAPEWSRNNKISARSDRKRDQ